MLEILKLSELVRFDGTRLSCSCLSLRRAGLESQLFGCSCCGCCSGSLLRRSVNRFKPRMYSLFRSTLRVDATKSISSSPVDDVTLDVARAASTSSPYADVERRLLESNVLKRFGM